MTMELGQWRLFLAIAERGSLTKAAEMLHTDQPALSRSLRRMERLAGATLFTRSSQGLALTDLGRRLHEDVRELVGHADLVESTLHAEARRAGGMLTIGTVDIYPISAAIAAASRDLTVSARQVSTEVVNLPWLSHPPAVLNRTIDVGFTLTVDGRTPHPQRLRTAALWEEKSWFALVSDQHELAGADTIHPRDLRDLPIHLPDKINSPHIHDLILESLAEAGVPAPRRAISNGTFADVLAQVAAGDGWTISAGTVPRHLSAGIIARPLDVTTQHTVQFALVWHVNTDLETIEAFTRNFRTKWRAITHETT